jgi:hypothetical protein
MSEPLEQEDRRSRRRFGLLWGALLFVMAVLVSIGTYAVVHNSGTPNHEVDAEGSGTAPVLDSPPVDVGPTNGSTSTATSTSRPTPGQVPPRDQLTQASEGGGALAPNPSAASTAALAGPRPHGISLILTSTLSDALRPGFPRSLNVTVRNVNSFPVNLYRIDVRVDASPKAGCLKSWVRAGRYRYDGGPPRRVPATSSVVVTLPIELINLSTIDQNACQGTYFPLRLSGIAVDPS